LQYASLQGAPRLGKDLPDQLLNSNEKRFARTLSILGMVLMILLSHDRGINQSIPPHRSSRNLPFTRKSVLTTIPLVVAVELLVIVFAQRGLDAMSNVALLVARDEGISTHPFSDPFLFVTLHPMTFNIRHTDWLASIVVMLVCLFLIVLLSIWNTIAAPIRYFLNLNALLIGGAALFLFLTGYLGYDSAAFSQLMLRTAVLTWLVIPIFVGWFASLFPFRILERLSVIALAVAWDIPLSIIRYSCFIAILAKTGAIAMTDLYFVCGPLLDVIPVICFLSILLVRLARALESRRAAWGLS